MADPTEPDASHSVELLSVATKRGTRDRLGQRNRIRSAQTTESDEGWRAREAVVGNIVMWGDYNALFAHEREVVNIYMYKGYIYILVNRK